jgi:hypothetical protein
LYGLATDLWITVLPFWFEKAYQNHVIILPMTRIMAVLPDNSYCLIFLIFFRSDVNLESSVIVAAEEDPES